MRGTRHSGDTTREREREACVKHCEEGCVGGGLVNSQENRRWPPFFLNTSLPAEK